MASPLASQALYLHIIGQQLYFFWRTTEAIILQDVLQGKNYDQVFSWIGGKDKKDFLEAGYYLLTNVQLKKAIEIH
jgi:hypothetical protein